MSKKRDWKKECDELNIPYEVIDGEIYLWPEYKKSDHYKWGNKPNTLREVYRTIKKIRNDKNGLDTQSLKEEDHRTERAKTRQMICHEKEFPTGKVHYEDPWGHD